MSKKISTPRAALWLATVALWQIGPVLRAADQTWTAGTATTFNWDDAANWSVAAPTLADTAILPFLIPNPGLLANPSVLTLGTSTANLVTFRNNYTLNSGTLTLGAGGLQADLGTSSVINSILAGTDGLTKTGGGSVRLSNAANSYTGATSIRNGSLIINSEAALGGTGAVSILTTNTTPSNGNLIGFGGGSLVLDGTAGGFTFSRSVNFEGRGPIGDRGSAILSLGNNTLSGTLTSGVSPLTPSTIRNSRINSVNGILTLSGTVSTTGTPGATFLTLGGVNSSVVGDFDLTGVLTGPGSIEKSGAGTLFLNPSNASGFTGNFAIGASSVGQQSTVRVTQTGVFGASTVTGTSRAAIRLNGGVLEFRNDGSLNFGALAGGRNVSLTAGSTIYTGPAAGGQGVNQVTTLGTFRLTANQTATFASRNGYGVTLGAWSQEDTGNNNTITTNMGGTLTFTGSAWGNGDAAARTLTISGTGNTLIQGDLLSSGTGTATKSLIKTGTGLLSLQGTAGTLTGNVSVQQGNLAITDFRSINMHTASGTANAGTINLGNNNIQGNLFIGIPGTTATAAGLSTSKALAIVGTTGGAAIIANQTGVNPVIFNAASFTVTGTSANGGAKTLTLGGTNTAENIINSTIPNGPVSGATTLLAATSTSSANITLNSVAGLNVGDSITGSGFQPGTTIAAINPLTRVVTLNLIPTASTASGQTITSANLVAPLSITKVGGGTWALSGTAGANTFTGPVTLSGGTLKLRANAATSTIIDNSVPVRFDATNGFAGSTLELAGQASTVNVETLGQLTLTQGANTLRLTPGASGDASMVFGSFNTTIGDGGTINVVGSTATSTVTLTGVATGLVAPHIHIGGSDFARSNSGVLVAPVYGTDATFVAAPAGTVLPVGQSNFSIDGDITDAVTGTASTLKFNGARALTLGAAQTLTIRTGAGGTDGGILATGGASSISGGTGITTGGGGALIIRVNGSDDSLTINSPITSTSTGGWTKSGAGTLTLTSTASANTGTVTINEGIVRLSGAGSRLAANNVTLNIRQGATLDLNGVTPGTVTGQFNNFGTVTSTAGPATFTVGGNNQGGTSYGIIAGQISLTKTGTGNQSWLGLSTHTGVTTIGSSGLVTVDTLADGGIASGIGASTADAANLVFDGSTGGLVYQGNIVDGTDNLASGSRSASTNRLFTLAAAATGATISSNASNNNALVWTSTGPIVNNTTAAATLIFGGTSLGDNTFAPQLVDSTASVALGINKTGAGQWNLANSANSYTGITRVTDGVLAVNNATALPANSPLVLGTNATSGIFQSSGTFARDLSATPTAGTGTITFGGTTGGGGFAAHGGPLTVTLNGGADLIWGSGGFVGTGGTQALILNSASSLDDVTFTNAIDLGAVARTVTVNDNGTTGADYATLSGVLSGAGGGLFKNGAGILRVGNANSYTGLTSVDAGTLVVTSLGSSTGGSTSSVGAGGVAMNDGNAIVLGNATTTGGNLVYVGAGETSDRKIRLRGTSANNTIHADGSGPLILTNVAHDTTETGNKTLNLRGSNADGNAITNVLTDNGAGVLSVAVDGGATWILSGANTYTGNTTASAGALGIGNNAALGTVGALVLNNGNVFASGGDRTIANAVTHNNNTTNGFLGDYNLTFSTALNLGAAANNVTTINSVVAGKAVTFNGGVTANALTANRSWTLDGPGETVINGNFTTSTAFGVRFDVNGGGTLTLGTNGATSNFNQSIVFADIDRGTIRFTTNEAINSSAIAAGGLIMSPEFVNSDTATLNLNGTTQTITSLTATTDGAVVIDNTSGTAATLRFGANDNVVNLNPATSTGSRTITDSGAGALSIIKAGNTTTTFNAGMTLTYQGTTSVVGGTLNINSPLNGTTGLRAVGGNLGIGAGLAAPGLITNVEVGVGSSLSLINGSADQLTNLTSMSLGAVGSGLLTLGLDIGANTATSDTLTLTGAATTLNTVRFNFGVLPGFGSSPTYDLISATSGLSTATYSLGFLPGGFSYNLTSSDTLVQLGVNAIAAGDLFWRGGVNNSWATITAGNSNFTTDVAGAVNAGGSPGTANTVVFSASSAVGPAINTTLDTPYTVDSLRFSSSPTGVTSVTIAPGSLATNSLTLAPALATNGLNLQASSGAATISAPIVLGTNQTWTVDGTGGSSLTVSGGVSGAGNLTIAASNGGIVTFSGATAATHTGSTEVTSGAILRGGAANTLSTASAYTIGSGGTLRLNGFANAIGSLSGSGVVENESATAVVLTTGALGGDTVFSGILQNGTLAGTLGVTKTGTGTLELSGANTYSGPTVVAGGTLTLSGARTGTSGAITVSSVAGVSAVLNITNGTHALGASTFNVGNAATTAATGTVNQSGGAVSFASGNALLIGQNSVANQGIYNLSGGSITTFASATRGILLGVNGGAFGGTFNLSGTGVLNMTAASGGGGNAVLMIGRSDAAANNTTNAFNQTGGTANVGILAMGGAASAGSTGVNSTLNLTGGTFVANSFTLLSAGNTNVSTINIGGTSDVTLPAFPTVRGTSSTATLTLDGGTLRPLASSSAYLGGLTNAFLTSNGARINVATGIDITVSQVLENAPSQTGTLLKLGAGRLVLTGVNTFTGAVTVNGGELSVTSGALANISGLSVGVGGNGSFDLYADGATTTWNVPNNTGITLSSATTSGGLGFELGTLGTSDKIVFTGAGALTVDPAGVGLINARGLLGFGIGTYELISGPNSIANISNLALGVLPGGFTYALDLTDPTKVSLNVLAAAAGELYWRGDSSTQSWANIAGGNTNWATDTAGLTEAGFTPGSGNVVNFSATNAGAAPIVTTLDSLFSVQGLKFLNSGTGPVSIGAGVGGVLTIGADGIEVKAGAPATVSLSAPVVLGTDQSWTVTDASSVLTSSGGITGAANLTKEGAGTLTLSGSNTYTGVTTVNGGKLRAGAALAFNATSAHSLGAAGGLELNGFNQTVASLAGSVGSTVSNGGVANAVLTTGANDTSTTFAGILENGALAGTLGLTKLGTGTLELSGANTYSGTTLVNGGTLTLSGARTGTSGAITVSSLAGINATLNIVDGVHNLAGSTFTVGNAATTAATGTVNQSGGAVSFTGGSQVLIGNVANIGNTGVYNLSGGTLATAAATTTGVRLGGNTGAIGIFNLSGTGSLQMTGGTGSLLAIGRSDAVANNTTNTFNQTGGTAAIGTLALGGSAGGSTGVVSNLNLTGGTFVANAFTLLSAGNTNTSSITIGGTADVTLPALPTVRGTGSVANLTLDGGTLRPLASSASYISGLTNAFLTSNGAKLNVGDGINITISQVLANAPSQAGTFLKEGTGRLVLTGANTFTGGIVVNGGRLEITGTNATSVPVNVNGGAISFSPSALANVTTFNIGATQDGALDLLYDGAAANWTVPSGVTINLGGAVSSGALGFNLGVNTATSDRMIFSPGSSLVVNAGGGRINGSALGSLTVGNSYDVVTGATITGPGVFEPGNLPSGFTYNVSTSLGTVTLNVVGQAAAGDLYWKGGVNNAWGGLGGGGTTSNWSSTSDGLTGTNYGPGANNLVIFSADTIAAPATTTLDSGVSVQGIRFLSSATPSVSLLPGAAGTLTLGSQGIEIQTGAQAVTTIAAPIVFSAPQTWTVADANSSLAATAVISGGTVNSTQALPGANVALTITGAGTVNLSNVANTFAGDILVNGAGLTVNSDRSWGGATEANVTSKTVTLINGARLNVNGAVNPGGVATTNYNLVRVGAGGATIDTAFNSSLTLDDAGQFGMADNVNLTKSGPGTLVLGADYGTLIGANTSMTVTGGLLRLQSSAGAFGTANKGVITLAGGNLDLRLNSGGNFGNNVIITNDATISTGRTTAAATDIGLGMGTLSVGAVTLTQSNGNGNTAPNVANLAFGATTFTGSPTFNVTNVNGAGIGTLTLDSVAESGGSYGIAKTGAGSLVITGVAGYTGSTSVTGGRLSILGQASTTGSLSVTGSGSVLAFRGGFATPSAINTISVGASSTLSLLNAARSELNVDSLSLGSTGGTITTLSLDVGDLTTPGDNGVTDLINLKTGGLLSLFTGNQVFLDLSDAGLRGNQQYNLISSVDGGLTTGALGTLDWLLANTPGGFTSFTINRTDNLISVSTGDLITGNLYWRGQTDTVWNGNVNNWTTDKAGAIASTSIPGTGNDVFFQSNAAAGAAVTTTLGQNFRINSLTFEPSTNIPTSVTINPGTVSTNRLEIAGAQGITLAAGGPGSVTIGTSVKLGADQTWTVADSIALAGANYANGATKVDGVNTTNLRVGMVVSGPGIPFGTTITQIISGSRFRISNAATAAGSAASLTAASSLSVTGALTGAFNLTKSGNGLLALANDNPLYTGVTTVTTGTLQVGNGGSTGNLGTGNVVNNATLEFNRTGTHTVDNLISGTGTLSKRGSSVMILGNNANTFSGPLVVNTGVVEFATVSNIGGGPSSLGQDSALTLSGGTLRFTGNASQATDRVVTTTTTGSTLANNGVGGASLTFNGLIVNTGTADGSQLTLTGLPGSQGFIRGGISQTGDAADMTVNGGTWNHEIGVSRIGDALTVTGATTFLNLNSGLLQVRNDFTVTAGATLNLNGSGVLSYNTTTLSADATLRATAGGIINLGASDAVDPNQFDQLRIGVDAGGLAGVFNMNAFNQTVTELHLGNRNLDRTGTINGTGTLTVLGNVDLYQGVINANLASSGTATFDKFGATGTVTLRGDNSALTSTGASAIYAGTLILDYKLSNTVKLRELSNLDMRGGTLQIQGNNSAATTQTVATLTLGEGGANVIEVDGGTGQEAVLNFGGLTRAANANDGTIRFILPNGVQSATNGITTTATLTNGLLGLSGFATVNDGTGTYFATTSGTNVVGLLSTPKNDVTTWVTGDHITDETTGFTGTLAAIGINSLRFNAAAGSDLNVNTTGVLGITSGGILVTSNVGGTPGIFGGTLTSGAIAANVPELIVTQDSAQVFEISSAIGTNHAITKSGNGTLRLSGNNFYTGYTDILQGTLEVSGGNAIGDNSLVILDDNRNTTFQLLSNETIGRLQGGRRSDGEDNGLVAIGANTLSLNQSASTTYSGVITGTGALVMNSGSVGNLNLNASSSGFTGTVVVNGGLLQLSGVGRLDASAFTINKGGNLLLDNISATRSGTRILDTAGITLNSADGTFNGQTIVRGLAIRTDQNAETSETIGVLTFNSGASYLSGEASGTTGRASIIATNFVRVNNATLSARGRALGTNSGDRNQFRIGNATNETAFVTAMRGGAGVAGSKNVSIIPWAIGESTTGALAATHMGNSFLTYAAATSGVDQDGDPVSTPVGGLRPLDLTSEYSTFAAAAANTNNIRESLTGNLALPFGPARTVNALVLHNNSVAAATHDVSSIGAGESLAITSGGLLFTLNPAAAAGDYGLTLGGFGNGITVGAANEYVIHVVNPDAGVPTKALTATISSALTTSADITKGGRGTLILSGTNTAGGGTRRTTINEGVLQIGGLASIGGTAGNLVFAGGTLRLGTGFIGDLSARTISFLNGGGTLDTNGNDATLAGSLGSGVGGFTKVGAGNLTLNAAATYTGPTVLSAGTITIGANNALGVGGDLTLAGGTTLALGSNNLSSGLVTMSGTAPVITGTGTITAANGFFFNNTTTDPATTNVDAVLAGAGGLRKAQANTLVLNGLNTYSGPTEIQAGAVTFNTIGNVGGGASGLGAPTTAGNGMIRLGLTTANVALNYIGTGHSSDRVLGMQGTTGGLTLNANGSGAVGFGVVTGLTFGAKTLTLDGTADASLVNSINGVVEGAGTIAIVKSGTSSWAITGAGTHSGLTTVNGGVLRISNSTALGAVTAGTVVADGATLQLEGGIAVGAEALTISGTGAAGQTGALVNRSGSNSFAGAITALSPLTISSEAGALALGALTGTDVGLTLASAGAGDVSFSGDVQLGTGAITKNGVGLLALAGNNSFTGGLALNAGIVEAGSAGALGTTGSITFGGGTLRHGAGNTVDYSARFVSAPGTAYKIATAGQSVTYASPLSGVGSTLTKSGAGTLVLSAVNTFDGQTAVTGGVLSISSEDNLGAAPAAFTADQLLLDGGTLLSTASFAINDANRGITLGALGGTFNTAPSTQLTLDTALTGAGQLTKDGAGTVLLNVVSTHTGGTVVQDGKLLLGVNNAISGAVTVSGAGALDIGANSLTVSSLNVTGSSASIAGTGSIDSAAGFGFSPTGTTTIGSVLAGSGAVTMSGTGTAVLTGANTYTGPTTISSGALLLDGGSLSTGTVSVASAATFGGIGSVAGPVVLAAGTGYQSGQQSLLNVGGGVRNGLNVLDLNGDLTTGNFSILDFYLTRTGFTQLDVAGAMNLDAGTRIRINLDSGYIPSAGSAFDLLNWGTLNIGGGASLADLLFPLPTDGMGAPVWVTTDFNTLGILRVDGLRTGPAITTNPVGGVVFAGDSVTFTLGVTGSDPLVIQWYKGPTTANPIPGANGVTYTIPAVVGADSGEYWARVTNGPNPEDTVDSQLATLDVVTLPRITAQPTGATLFPSPGTNKTFNVTAIGPGTLTYVWKKATVAIPGAPNDDEYTINGVQVADSGNYTVTVSNGFGSVTSDVAVLTVSQAIAFTQQPLTPVPAVPEGNPVTLTAAVTGDGPFTYQWERAPRIGLTGSNFGPFAPVSGQTAPTITQTLDLTNQGKYRLVVSNAYTTLTSNEATVIFGAAQVVVTTQPISKVVAVGSTLELDVVTSGGKPQKFQWFFKGKAVGDETDSTLRIEDVTSARAGPYFCRISNSLVSGSTQVDTQVVYVSVVDRKPGRFVLTQPGTVSLSVTATADKADPLTYQWFVDDGLVSAPNVQPVAGATLRTLKVTNLTAGRKRFFCRVSGGGGSRFLDGGDNLVFIYTQPPALQPEGSWNLPDTVVSQPYSYQVPMVDNPLEAGQPNPLSMPVSFKAVGLPPGLTINSAGLISGRATVERRDKVTKLVIPYTVTITATNKLGTTTPIIKNLVVNPLDVGLIGAFTGPIDRNSSLNGNLGGMINFTTTKTGSYSGSLTMGARVFPFKGALNSAISDPTNPSVTVKVSRGTTLRPLLVSFKLNSAGFVTGPVNPLTRGTITDGRTIAQFDGWRNTWLVTPTNKTPALAYSGYYTMGLDIPLPLQGTTTNPSIPQGTGYASFTVSSTTGKLTVSGRLADGTAFTTATYVGPTGEVLVYRALYGTTATSTRGSVLGKLQIDQVVALDTTDNTLDGTVSWWKVAQPVSTSTAGRTYAAGFGPFDLSVLGSRYLPPLKGFPVLGLAQNATTNNARLNLVEANSEASLPVMTGSPANTVAVRVDNASKVFPDVLNNPRKVSMTITPATGLVSFKFSLSQLHPFGGSPATVARAVSGVGMIVRNGTEQQAWGYFMLPQLPSSFSEKTTATPILSGQAVFEKIP